MIEKCRNETKISLPIPFDINESGFIAKQEARRDGKSIYERAGNSRKVGEEGKLNDNN